MNIIDLAVLFMLGIGFLIGWYKGFLYTVVNSASFFIAWLLAFIFNGPLSSLIYRNSEISKSLLYYTAGAEKLSDMTIANVDVAELSVSKIQEVISTSGLPKPIATQMEQNILRQVFYEDGIYTMSDYFNQTIINLALNLICFLMIYFAVRIISVFIIELVDKVYSLPVLKTKDSLYGGLFGLLQGAMIAFVVFSVIPLFFSILPLDSVNALIQESLLGRLFFNANIIFNVLPGTV